MDFLLNEREKYARNTKLSQYAVYCGEEYGPVFGGGSDIYVMDNCNTGKQCFSNFGHTYPTGKLTNLANSARESHLAGSYYFNVEEIAVSVVKMD